MTNKEKSEKIFSSIEKITNKENKIYFLVYDTKNNPKYSVKYIYDLALTLKENNFNVQLLVEDDKYEGVGSWLSGYEELTITPTNGNNVTINQDDVLIIPEYYCNMLETLNKINCTKVLLVQRLEYLYETLPFGVRPSTYGIYTIITTTEHSKKYLNKVFNECITYVVPPILGEHFKPSEQPIKPFVAISIREKNIQKKIISEFFLLYPQLRFITFKEMVGVTYETFAENLKECAVAVWIDDDSTFGTFPLECMMSGVPVIGKVPKNEPDWIGENGIWTYDESKITELLGEYMLSWLNGVTLAEEVKTKIDETLLPYDNQITKNNIVNLFNSFNTKRINSYNKIIETLKEEV